MSLDIPLPNNWYRFTRLVYELALLAQDQSSIFKYILLNSKYPRMNIISQR